MSAMKMKKMIICIIVLFIVGLIGFIIINKEKSDNSVIPDDYIAVFYGGVGEVTYSTYIYKIDNGQANYGFEYINTVNTTISWGSSEWISRIIGKGKVDWTDDVFAVAKENNAYSFVIVPGNNKPYAIEEFMHMFLMN